MLTELHPTSQLILNQPSKFKSENIATTPKIEQVANNQNFPQRILELRLAQIININGGNVNIIVTDEKTKEKILKNLQGQSNQAPKTVHINPEQTPAPSQNLQSAPIAVSELKSKPYTCPEGYNCIPKVAPICPEGMICTPKPNGQHPIVSSPQNTMQQGNQQSYQPNSSYSVAPGNSFEGSQGSGVGLITPGSFPGGFGQPSSGSVNFGINANYTIRF